MEFKDKKILVVGAGISGIAAIELLGESGAQTILFDAKEDLDKEEIRKKLPESFNGQIVTGELTKDCTTGLDMAVLSPGVPTDLPFINELSCLLYTSPSPRD